MNVSHECSVYTLYIKCTYIYIYIHIKYMKVVVYIYISVLTLFVINQHVIIFLYYCFFNEFQNTLNQHYNSCIYSVY